MSLDVLASVERALKENEEMRRSLGNRAAQPPLHHNHQQSSVLSSQTPATAPPLASTALHKFSQFVSSPSKTGPAYNSYFGHVAAVSPTKKVAANAPPHAWPGAVPHSPSPEKRFLERRSPLLATQPSSLGFGSSVSGGGIGGTAMSLEAIEAALASNEAMRRDLEATRNAMCPTGPTDSTLLAATVAVEPPSAASANVRQRLQERYGLEDQDPHGASNVRAALMEQLQQNHRGEESHLDAGPTMAGKYTSRQEEDAMAREARYPRPTLQAQEVPREMPSAAPTRTPSSPGGFVGLESQRRIWELEQQLQERDTKIDTLQAQLTGAKREIAEALEASEQIARQALEEQREEMDALRAEVEKGKQALEMERLHLDYALQKLGVRNILNLELGGLRREAAELERSRGAAEP